MTIQDKEKVYELIQGNQIISSIQKYNRCLERDFKYAKMDTIADKKMLKKILKLKALMQQASDLATEIEANYWEY